MIYDGIEYFPISEDPEVLARVRAHDETGVGSDELGRFARDELGLTPPAHDDDRAAPDVVLVFDMETGAEYYVWDVHDVGDEEPAEPERDGGWTS